MSSSILRKLFTTLWMIPLLSVVGAGWTPLLGQNINLELTTTTTTVAPGETFLVDLTVDNSGGFSVRGLQHVISWDSAFLRLTALQLPGELAGSPTPEILVWNAPQPTGTGGDQGCSTWWDGSGIEALSLGLILEETSSDEIIPLAQMEFRVIGSAMNGDTTLTTPDPDLTCGWIGSIITDPQGAVLPTETDVLELSVSDVPRPTQFSCGEASQTVYLSWQEPVSYSTVKIARDGVLIAELPGGTQSYEDPNATLGAELNYSLQGVLSNVSSPEVSCQVTVDGLLEAPMNLECFDNGGAVLLTWENPLSYDQIDVFRQGSLLTTLTSNATSFSDDQPITGQSVDYFLRGSLEGVFSSTDTCQISLPIPQVLFIRGDVNSDGELNLVDPVTTLQFLFVSGDMPCASAADFNDDGNLDLADAVNLLAYQFTGGMSPAAPFPMAGFDPTPDSLGCDVGCFDSTCGAGIPGDECSGAIDIGLGTTPFDTSAMTDSPEPYDDLGCEGTLLGLMYSDIWFDFTAPSTGLATISLCSSEVEFDSDLVIYSGSCSQLTQVACNGDGVDAQGQACPDFTSRISGLPMTAGESFLIRVGGFDSVGQGESGPGSITVTID